jgi:microcystin-dependent protein
MALSLPVGSIVAFAAPVYEIPNDWRLCDGSILGRNRYPDLFAAIGTAHGAPDGASFALPDLRGRFLRGIAAGQQTDPDAGAREEPRPDLAPNQGSGGNKGDHVGSRQTYATGKSWNPMEAEIYKLPTSIHQALSPIGAPDDICVVHNNSRTLREDLIGGDAESRPHNKYLYYIIKVTESTGADLSPGAVLALASDGSLSLAPEWLPCDGTSYASADARYNPLFEEIGTSHGGSASEFCVPDLRGFFVRGVAETTDRDPNAEARGPARPDLPAGQQGNSGNAIGSSQVAATGKPKNNFETVFPYLPDDGVHCWNSTGYDTGKTNWNGRTIPIAQQGGDSETRPVNTAVDWIIQAGADAQAPIGTVLAHGGENPQLPGWLVCNGQSVNSSDYPELFKAIGTTYGSGTGSGSFHVPDYRGYFLRGCDQKGAVDPDAASRFAPGTTLPIPPGTTPAPAGAKVGSVQNWATARPNNPFEMHVPCLPESGEQVFNSVPSHSVGTVSEPSPTIKTCTLGGDNETRPENIAVTFLIRAS